MSEDLKSSSTANETQTMVSLRSGDGCFFRVEKEIAFRCAAVRRKFLSSDFDAEGSISFNNVSSKVLNMVLEFCRYVRCTLKRLQKRFLMVCLPALIRKEWPGDENLSIFHPTQYVNCLKNKTFIS